MPTIMALDRVLTVWGRKMRGDCVHGHMCHI